MWTDAPYFLSLPLIGITSHKLVEGVSISFRSCEARSAHKWVRPLDKNYFIRIRGQVKGPYDPETLQEMARRNQFARHNEVSADGEEWYRASEFPELFPERAARKTVQAAVRKQSPTDHGSKEDTTAQKTPSRESSYAIASSSESQSNEDARWFYGSEGKEIGGVTFNELCELFKRGVLTQKSYVWNPEIEWTQACDVAELAFLVVGGDAVKVTAFPVLQEASTNTASSPSQTAIARGLSRTILFQVALLICAVLMASSMFLPWWSIRISSDDDDAKGNWGKETAKLMTAKDQEIDAGLKLLRNTTATDPKEKRKKRLEIKILKLVKTDKRWWKSHLKGGEATFEENLIGIAEKVDDDEMMVLSLWLWGWRVGIAIMGLVFGSVILTAIILFLCLSAIRVWNWIVSMVASVFGICAIIFSVVWIFTAPGDDAGALTPGPARTQCVCR